MTRNFYKKKNYELECEYSKLPRKYFYSILVIVFIALNLKFQLRTLIKMFFTYAAN